MLKRIITINLTCICAIVLLSCGHNSQNNSPEEKVKTNITNWIKSRPSEYNEYQPINFGPLTARYRKDSRTIQLYSLLEDEKNKTNPNQDIIDSLQNLLKKTPGTLLGYTITHKYQTKNVAGETITSENLFFLDSLYRIVTILNEDAYDQIMDEELFFRPEKSDSTKTK
ncbi:MAG TPA: hypothetical protein PLA24_02140 [Tenuifilaceae bacterium]|nr:hypothetical protein [Tenuifilaceae bacterium]HRX31073.1 hypothetical protein [Tenuifilaceae bacterium]